VVKIVHCRGRNDPSRCHHPLGDATAALGKADGRHLAGNAQYLSRKIGFRSSAVVANSCQRPVHPAQSARSVGHRKSQGRENTAPPGRRDAGRR
jgi:hypothetical protein